MKISLFNTSSLDYLRASRYHIAGRCFMLCFWPQLFCTVAKRVWCYPLYDICSFIAAIFGIYWLVIATKDGFAAKFIGNIFAPSGGD